MSQYEIRQTNTDDFNGTCDSSTDDYVTTGYQYADVGIPVQLNPNITIGNIEIEYCDEPVVSCCENSCRQNCNVTVTQRIRIKIPVSYEIDACAGEGFITCSSDTACGQ